MAEVKELWTGKDDDGCECVLDRPQEDRYQFAITEGSFSGYPCVNLGKDDLMQLFYAIGKELGILKPEEIRVLHIMKEQDYGTEIVDGS